MNLIRIDGKRTTHIWGMNVSEVDMGSQHFTFDDGDFVLRAEVTVPSPRGEVFDFFSDARNLELLTPPFMRFRVRTEEQIDMDVGTVIEYDLRIRGVPVRWQSLVRKWDPPTSFEDEQIRGPYLRWHHTHEFEDSIVGTIVRDTVRYRVPGGRLINRLLVAPDLRRIFSYRHERIVNIFNTEVSTTVVRCSGGDGNQSG